MKRPGQKASKEQQQQYRAAVKQRNLSRSFVEMGKQLRQELDEAGGRDKILVLTGDGSFCNRTCFGEIPERTVLLSRARKDAKLCFHAPIDSRRFYATEKFTPEKVRLDESRAWKTTKIFYGGKGRKIRYKEVNNVYWQGGGGQAQLWNVTSVPKQPVLAVASYSALLLASLQAFGAERGTEYAELPKWRRNARRPSCLDLITLLRKEMVENPALLVPLNFKITDQGMTRAASA